jgi:NAD(P)-dependent dehydrogenase (short-subunit alcohol dehydrogenase family)
LLITGITSAQSIVKNADIGDLRKMFETNTIGPIVLYQAFASLLTPGAKFVVISSLIGKISDAIPWSYTAYATSKAAVNYVTKKIDQESADLIAFPVQ